MKAVKYLLMGAFIFGLSAPVMAQDYISAIDNVSKALKSDPTGVGSAKQVVKDYLKQFKKNPKALVALGNSYLAVKNYEQANAIADMALKKNKNLGDAYILKGDAEALKDDGGNAAMWYQQAMQLDPKNPMGYTRYANVYRKRSPSESERVLNELRTNVPEYPIDAEMGHNYYESGNDAKAFEAFSKAKINSISESYIAEYIRTDKVGFMEGMAKTAAMAAERLHLPQKGNFRSGSDADVVIFDYEAIRDTATFEEPTLVPEGIDYVLIGGEIAAGHGTVVNAKLGRAVRFGAK